MAPLKGARLKKSCLLWNSPCRRLSPVEVWDKFFFGTNYKNSFLPNDRY